MSGRILLLEPDGLPVRLVRSSRAKRITLRISAHREEPELVIPKRGTIKEGKAFAESRLEWLRRCLDERPRRVPFAHGAEIPYMGRPCRMTHLVGGPGNVRREGDVILVPASADGAAPRLEAWLRREARREIGWRAETKAHAIGAKIARLTIRDSTSQWGSCTARGRLSFSWRLIFAPIWVIDYVIAHEVTHLAHMNHSKRFWAQVGKLCIDVEAAREWLRTEGINLHRYG